jgi:hypothetical protein
MGCLWSVLSHHVDIYHNGRNNLRNKALKTKKSQISRQSRDGVDWTEPMARRRLAALLCQTREKMGIRLALEGGR